MKRFRYRAYPTEEQAMALARVFGCVRVVFNDVIAGRPARRCRVPGQAEQVVAFVEGEVQALRDRGDHLLRRRRTGAAFESRVRSSTCPCARRSPSV